MLYLPHGWTHEALMSKGPRLIARSRQAKMWMRRMLRDRNFHVATATPNGESRRYI